MERGLFCFPWKLLLVVESTYRTCNQAHLLIGRSSLISISSGPEPTQIVHRYFWDGYCIYEIVRRTKILGFYV